MFAFPSVSFGHTAPKTLHVRPITVIEPRHKKTCFMPYANKAADLSAHPLSLISALVVHCLDSIIHTLAKYKLSRL